MRRIGYCFLAIVCSIMPLSAGDAVAPVGTRVADFTLPEPLSAKPWSLVENTRDAKATVIVFSSTTCPVASAYTTRIIDMAKRYSPDAVVFVGINSHSADEPADVAKAAKEWKLPFPVLKDDRTTIADKLSVERVPTAIVLDATRTVRYFGRIDDQFSPGVHKAKQGTRELANAIEAVLEGHDMKVSHTTAMGCKLTRPKAEKPSDTATYTYTKHVSRIIQAKCQECHRPGEAAPFSLMTYKQTIGWADMMREVVADDVMPPWHADAPRGHFKNDRRLSDAEKKAILGWIDNGCPEGDVKDAAREPSYIDGWRLGREPDAVLKMLKPISIPANAMFGLGFPYQYVMVGDVFEEEKWVQAIEVRPSYRAVVHHILCFIIPPGGTIFDVAGGQFGTHLLGAFVPGDQPIINPDGFARRIAKGSRLVFEVHYTPNGRAGVDQSMIGIIYAKKPPKHELYSTAIFNPKFVIPAGVAKHEVLSEQTFDKSVTLLSLTPHMHLRGKSFRYDLITPDGKREVLLNVPKYDFNWQASYEFRDARTIPAKSRIECTAIYDNSKSNPFNPDPASKVRWGTQTWNEMMIGFAMYHEAK